MEFTVFQTAQEEEKRRVDVISVGQKIKIPGSGVRTYTVKSGDSLWAIAEKQLGDGSRYNEIKTMNGLTSNTIYAGQTLKLPA